MKKPDFDVIIIGSGPAGVTAAFPFLKAGLRVLMIDGGYQATVTPPSKAFLSARSQDADQWRWMIGEDFYALKNLGGVSPKLRAPTHDFAFKNFANESQISSHDFVAIGSLATGGLSNAWGCGVARLSESELSDFPCSTSDLFRSYATVSDRIGISGSQHDDLSDYFGLDAWSQPPIQMDTLHEFLYTQYVNRRTKVTQNGFRLGRSRVAVLSGDRPGRSACDLSGNCLWGCHRKSLYSATDELTSLRLHSNFYEAHGFIVDELIRNGEILSVGARRNGTRERQAFSARKVILAAGTLATTRLALHALRYEQAVPLLSCPTGAFLLWLPRFLGLPRKPAFALGQLSFTLPLCQEISAFGSTFNVTGIPLSEFARHLPLRRRNTIDLLKGLLSSCLVGNVFLPGNLSTSTASLRADGSLFISGGYSDDIPALMTKIAKHLRISYGQLGAKILPGSFRMGLPGSDIHYAGTLPMKMNPSLGQTTPLGELHGCRGVHVVDGACLPTLTEKSHTLTLMANADRIGRAVASQMSNSQ
ncbi:MAG: FAD-binding protein [Pseudomonadota bacterium]